MAEPNGTLGGASRPHEDAEADGRLVEWAQAIADGRAMDWERLRSVAPELAASISALRLVETVISAHRSPKSAGESVEAAPAAGAATDPAMPPEHPEFPPLPPDASWGSLRLVEKIGEGTYGEVFRAFDSALQLEVAVKILRRSPKDEAATESFFEEARRLARVRHPNVLQVFGAAQHDGRVGIWSELVRGRTLEESILTDGPFGPREAAVIGIDLCGAVAAVHRAGLLHRDLKTRNVMREQGGRIVLMDFGAVSELAGTPLLRKAGYGTPITVAPELLRGDSATPATDIYALGVLLYRLVTGRYPVEATSLVELVEKHHRGEWTPLREVRPDLPGDFLAVIEKAIDPEPKRRHSGPGDLERALKGTLDAANAAGGTGVAPVSGALPAWLRPAGIVVAALLAIAVGHFAADLIEQARRPEARRVRAGAETAAPTEAGTGASGAPSGEDSPGLSPNAAAPAVDLVARARLYRQRGSAAEPLSEGATVAPGDGLFLEVQSAEPMHVYVLDEDEAGHVFVLFPLAGFEPGNPLPPNVRHRLPGRRAGGIENWRVTAAGGTEDLMVVGSRTALTDLERDLKDTPHAIPGAPVVSGQLSPQSLEGSRGIGGTVPGVAPPSVPPGSPSVRLAQILTGLEAEASRSRNIWIWHITLRSRQ